MERRAHQRITVNAEGVFILDNKMISSREFPGTVEDISEGGIKITMSQEDSGSILPYLNPGNCLHFHAFDTFHLFGNNNETIISGKVEILRHETIDDIIILGCQFKKHTNEIFEYISNKKISLFLDLLSSGLA